MDLHATTTCRFFSIVHALLAAVNDPAHIVKAGFLP